MILELRPRTLYIPKATAPGVGWLAIVLQSLDGSFMSFFLLSERLALFKASCLLFFNSEMTLYP